MKLRSRLTSVSALVLTMLVYNSVFAGSHYWYGTVDNKWDNDANWGSSINSDGNYPYAYTAIP